jgi:Ser/Thr protein kinase RdoA (MazF antagonist)
MVEGPRRMTRPDFAVVARHFRIRGEFWRAERLPSGHIHDSYAAWFCSPGAKPHRALLQRINHHVFRSPERLMENIEAVTAHLRAKIRAAGGDPDCEALTLIRTADGGLLHRTPDGEWWRAMIFIEGARTYETPGSLAQVRSAGRVIGRFQATVSDFPVDRLDETIPNFHHTPKRFEAFVGAVERDSVNRCRSARAEIEFVGQRAADTRLLLDLLDAGKLPRRVTHNDTKFDNVLIDDVTGEGICLIDLDTVMPGLAAYDFGDAVRSAANTAAEDDPDLDRVCFDLEVYEQLVAGYLEAAGSFLAPAEIEVLAFSARLMSLECGIRFLTDYLDGDRYFRTLHPRHNLDRCRSQFKLVRDMEGRRAEMERIVDRHRPV